MTDTPNAPAPTSVAPDEATMKRSLQMKMFASETDHLEVGLEFQKTKDATKATKVLGQVIGQIFDVKEKLGRLPNGEQKVSLQAIGDFEAVNYKTGEVWNSSAAYLPGYFLETVQSMLKLPETHAIDFAIEIVLTPTGKPAPAIQTAYEVRNLIRRRPENPLNRMKQELAAAGRLRLPPPTENVAGLIEGEVRVVEPEPVFDERSGGEHEDQPGAGDTSQDPGAGSTPAARGKGAKEPA